MADKKPNSYDLPNCNVTLLGIGRDVNGNKTIKLKILDGKPFSIQLNGGALAETYLLFMYVSEKGRDWHEQINQKNLETISDEVCDYISNYGSPAQKKQLRIYEK